MWAGQPGRLAFLDMVQREIDVFGRYSAFYGYVFYLVKSR